MPTHRTRRRPPELVRQGPLILVVGAMTAGLVLVLLDGDHERGTVVFAASICLAAVLRAVLPEGWAGALRVRSRWMDVATLAVLGVGGLVAALALIQDWDVDLLVRWLGAAQ